MYKQMDGDDDFFLIKIMEASEFTVLNSGEDHNYQESIKRWENEEMLDSIRHLFGTAEDTDRPTTVDQDGEQDTTGRRQ